MRKIAILLVVLVVALSSCKTIKKGMNDAAYQPATSTTTAQPEPVKEPVVDVKVDNEGPSIGASTTAPKKEILVKTEEVTIEKETATSNDLFDFYVIMGSFSNSDNARKLQSELRSEGNVSEVLRSKAGLLRVSTLGTNNENEARALIEKIRIETPEHSDVWLLKTQK